MKLAVLALASFALCSPAFPAQEEAQEAARLEAALEALKGLSKSRIVDDRLKILGDHGGVKDKRVVNYVARAITDKDPRVVRAALFELRGNEHPRALEKLHAHYRKNRALKKDAELHVELIKAIGSKADPSSVAIFERDAFAYAPREVRLARIYALGNIRTTDSITVLIKLLGGAGTRRGGEGTPTSYFQISLMLLSGRDFGLSKKDWLDWWSDSRRDFEVAKKAPKLPEELRGRWERFWGLRRTYDRTTKRSRRGDDPEQD